ncbi:MAG: hypothetical protein SNJ59_11025 [Aggregatilineales bacterium]
MDCKWNVRHGGWSLPKWGWFFLGFWGWIMLARLGLPIVVIGLLLALLILAFIRMSVQHANSAWTMPADKRKRGPYFSQTAAECAGEKPKRRPAYVVGDDGELVELVEDMPPKAKRDRGPLDFV